MAMRIAIMFLALATVCGAQQQATTGCFSTDGVHCDHSQPAPLKCGKWEHLDNACYVDMSPGRHGTCLPAKCVPDLHTVTEREWQDVLSRLKELERIAK